MINNAVLGYVDLICRTKYSTKHTFFNKKSFDPITVLPNSTSSSTIYKTPPRRQNSNARDSVDLFIEIGSGSPESIQELPIHLILKDIYAAMSDHDTTYFEPMILHYWQLQRLLEILRCNTPLLALPAAQRSNNVKIEQIRKEIGNSTHPDIRRRKEIEIQNLERANERIREEIVQEELAIKNNQRSQDKENLQAVLVLSTLLNIVYREGMSVPLLSDQFRLEAQQHEARHLLTEHYGIVFEETEQAFVELFSVHHTVQTVKTVPERIVSELKDDWAWLKSQVPTSLDDETLLERARYYVSRVLGVQMGHAFYNHLRLGGTRARRLLAFLEPFLKNETYTAFFKTVDPYMRFVLSYLNWMFFIPRLSLHLSLLSHHLFNKSQLQPLEGKLPLLSRFRAHWTRFGFEFVIDSYWFLNGLKVCFWLPGGALSPQGIFLSLTIQVLDLFCSIVRAVVELRRLSNMAADLNNLEPNLALTKDIDKRFWFEAFALGYMIFHFSVLMISLCLTLPAMAAISTMLPVIGGTCAVLVTVLTYHMQNYFVRRRESEFECRPKPIMIDEKLRRLPSAEIRNEQGYASRASGTWMT